MAADSASFTELSYLQFWDRQGNPIELSDWSTRKQQAEYRRVACTDLPIGDTAVRVITAWLGTDQGNDPAHPLIFGTIACPADESMFFERTERFAATEHDALLEHLALCTALLEDPTLAQPDTDTD